MPSNNIISNFAITRKFGAFYTGGHVESSTDGEHLYCQCSNQINVLDTKTGQVVSTIGKEDDDEVTSFILSPDGQMLISASRQLLLKQWCLSTQTVERTWKAIHTGPVSCMGFDVTSTLLATGGSDSTIKVWDVIKRYCTHNLKNHTGVITDVKYHPDIDKLLLFSASEDTSIRVWNLQTSMCIATLQGHFSAVTCLQFSTDENRSMLFSSGRDSVILTWNLKTYEQMKTIPVYEPIESLIMLHQDCDYPEIGVHSSDQHFITAGSKGVLRVWNSARSECVHPKKQSLAGADNMNIDQGDTFVKASLVKSQQTINVVTSDHAIIQYDSLNLKQRKQFIGYLDDVLDIKFFGPDDSHIAVATNSNHIKVFDMASWSCQVLVGHTDIVMAIDIFHSGHLMASVSKDNSLRIWQMNPVTSVISCVAIGNGHTESINAVAFSKLNASFVISGGQDRTLKVWPLPDQFNEDEIAVLHSRLTEHVHDKDINAVTTAPNDSLIATASMDKTAKIWSSSKLSLLGVLRGHSRGIWALEFSPVDQCIATASADSTIRIWALTDFTCVKTFEGHQSSVLRVQFLSRGMQLLSSGSDGLLKLWSVKNNECIKSFDEHEDKVWALTTDAAENVVVTGAGDSTVIVWKNVTEEEKEEARMKQQEYILKEQELSNLLMDKKYLKAIGLAITLDQPFRVLNILKEILGDEMDSKLENTLMKLRSDQLDAVLKYSARWNMNSKHCYVAQKILAIVLQNMSHEELLELPNVKSTIEALIPYSERHFERLNRITRQATFVDYTWHCIKPISTSLDDHKVAIQNSAVPRLGNESSAKSTDVNSELESTVVTNTTLEDVVTQPKSPSSTGILNGQEERMKTSALNSDTDDSSGSRDRTLQRSTRKTKKISKNKTVDLEENNEAYGLKTERKSESDVDTVQLEMTPTPIPKRSKSSSKKGDKENKRQIECAPVESPSPTKTARRTPRSAAGLTLKSKKKTPNSKKKRRQSAVS